MRALDDLTFEEAEAVCGHMRGDRLWGVACCPGGMACLKRWKWNGKKAFHLRDRRRFARQLKEEIDEAALAKLNSSNWDAIKAMSPEEFAGWCVTDLPPICAEGQSSRASITEWLKADGERKK